MEFNSVHIAHGEHCSFFFGFHLFISKWLCCSWNDLFLKLSITFCSLAKVAFYTTNVHTKHTLQIYEKLSYEALNRHFCQTAVSGCPSVRPKCFVGRVCIVCLLWTGALACTLFCFCCVCLCLVAKANVSASALALEAGSFWCWLHGQFAILFSNFIKFKLVKITINVTPTSAAIAKTKLL